MHKKKILLAEDDLNFGMMLQSYLSVNSYEVTWCKDGNEAYGLLSKSKFDLCIFDVMMPNKDGFSLAESFQKLKSKTPFIFLTARAMKEDQIKGYQMGAMDYLVKPFDPEILLLKLEAILRIENQSALPQEKYFKIGSFHFDADLRSLTRDDKQTKLSPKESELLHLLLLKNGEVLTREEALLNIWKESTFFTTKSMDVYITKLRNYLKKDDTHKIEIKNLHSKGFVLSIKDIE